MAGRKRLPKGLVSGKQAAARINPEEQLDFSAAAYMMRRTKASVMRKAIFEFIEDAKRLDPKRFQQLRKSFAEGKEPE